MPKAKSIYIFGAEPQSGKSVILLGIMELLSRHVNQLGFFRPLVREGETKDDDIRLISNRYHLTFPNHIKYGMTYEMARLGRVDAVVFTGAISENSAPIRKQCCQGLEGLGITVDDGKNEKACGEVLEIQQDGALVKVLAIRTNEEREIAEQTVKPIEKGKGSIG